MFPESLLESGASRTSNRRWTTAASFAFQITALACLTLVPILYPDALSLVRIAPITVPIFSNAPQQPSRTPESTPSLNASTRLPVIEVRHDSRLHYRNNNFIAENTDPSPPSGFLPPTGHNNLNIAGPVHSPNVTLALPEKPVIISDMDPGALLLRIQPVYPSIAVQSHTQGQVVLRAIISKEGAIESLQVVSGNALLARAAREAVMHWRYRPTILNGQPVEVETQVTVNFILGRN